MFKLVTFQVLGCEPCPWSVPHFGTGTSKAGKKFRFMTYDKKSKPEQGILNLPDWAAKVAAAARDAMGGRDPWTCPVKLHFDFFTRTPPGRRHGELWDCPVKLSPKTKKWGKSGPRGRSEPDLLNLVKGTEDALQGIVIANDCQTRLTSAAPWFGPTPGVKVTAYAIEPSDFPGSGDPVM